MSNELTIAGKQNVLDMLHGVNSDIPINPFEREIKLTTYIVGETEFFEEIRNIAIKLTPNTEVKLIREKDEGYKKYVVRVEIADTVVGYIGGSLAPVVANLMDAGKMIYGRLAKCTIGYAGADLMIDIFMRD